MGLHQDLPVYKTGYDLLLEIFQFTKQFSKEYKGILKHYRTYKLRKRMLLKYLSGWWWKYVYLRGGVAKFVLKQKPMKR